MKILIVEDDALLLQGLMLALEGEGYVCDGVTTVRDAEAQVGDGAQRRGFAGLVGAMDEV